MKFLQPHDEDINFRNFFDENVVSLLDEIQKTIDGVEPAEQNHVSVVRYWWLSFYENSRMLGYLLEHPRSNYQFTMTMRLLLEISADLHFIEANPSNISRLNEAQQAICEKQGKNPAYSYRDATKDAKKICLCSEVGESVGTEKRIESVGEKDLVDWYSKLSIASHFNHMETIWQGNQKTRRGYYVSLLFDFTLYPLVLEIAVRAIGKIISESSLEEYDTSNLQKAIDELYNKVQKSSEVQPVTDK